MFQNLHGALGECVLGKYRYRQKKRREDCRLDFTGKQSCWLVQEQCNSSADFIANKNPIPGGTEKKQPFPFSVNFLFNEALALACFDGKVEDGIDDLPRIEPGLFSSWGLTAGVEARALAFFQASVSPGFPACLLLPEGMECESQL